MYFLKVVKTEETMVKIHKYIANQLISLFEEK